MQSFVVQEYEMKNSRNKQFMSFEFHAVLSSMLKPHSILFCGSPTMQSVKFLYAEFFPLYIPTCLLIPEYPSLFSIELLHSHLNAYIHITFIWLLNVFKIPE